MSGNLGGNRVVRQGSEENQKCEHYQANYRSNQPEHSGYNNEEVRKLDCQPAILH